MTDNFLKVRIPAGVERNRRVLVQGDVGDATGDRSLPQPSSAPAAGRAPFCSSIP